jgi:acyl carrier protein
MAPFDDPTSVNLATLPESEQYDTVEALVTSTFRAALLMDDDEDLPLESSYLELGLTSLRLMDIRRSLEERFGLEIDTAALFNRPTVEQLVDYLVQRLR